MVSLLIYFISFNFAYIDSTLSLTNEEEEEEKEKKTTICKTEQQEREPKREKGGVTETVCAFVMESA